MDTVNGFLWLLLTDSTSWIYLFFCVAGLYTAYYAVKTAIGLVRLLFVSKAAHKAEKKLRETIATMKEAHDEK